MGKNIGMKIGLSLCGLFVMISSFFAPSSVAATMPSYDLEHTFPSEPRDYKQVREPADVAFDLSGNAYVADYGYHTIIKYDATGQYVTHWELFQPIAISVDGTSNEVYVGRSVSNEVHIFDDNGNPLHTFGSSGSGDGEFDWIWDIAIDDKYIYVSDRYNHRVQIFNKSDRSFLTSVGENGAGDGQFNLPAGLAIGSDHQLYVADTNNGRIQLFTFDSGTSTWSYHSQLSITAPVSLHLEEDTSGAHILHVLERSGKSSSRVELTGHDLDAVDPTTVVNNPLGGNVLSGHINTKIAWNPVNEQRYAVDRTAIVRMDDIKDTANWIGCR